MRGKAELAQKLPAVFPREAEGARIRDPEARDDCGKCRRITFRKLAVNQRIPRPIHQLRGRDLVVDICGDFIGECLFS